MPITYHCDHCDAESPSLAGWHIISAQFLHVDPAAPLSGRVLDGTAPDLLFDTVECRDAWASQAGLTAPSQATPPPAA